MARYTGASCRLCRREGQKLFLKGERCYSDKCAIVTRKGAVPGQHGQGRKKVSEYGIQLRAKQKAKRFYGVSENQFYHYYEMAERRPGITGENLLRFLESRLDNIVYRAGFANSRKEARQLVLHRHFTVNGKKVNIPSYIVKKGDVIAVKEGKAGNKFFAEVKGTKPAANMPKWLEFDSEKLEGKVVELPVRSDIDSQISEHMIVELYSK